MSQTSSRPDRPGRLRLAVVCTPGLESVCAGEMKALGLKPKPAGPGLLEASTNRRGLYAANVWLRTASRVMVRVATFRATDFVHLQDHASRIDWDRWTPPGFAARFRITSTDSKLYHTKAIAQRLHQVSIPPSLGEPEQDFIVRIDRNTVTISADSSGAALYHRPWRTDLVEAPLRTTMASALVSLSGWEPHQALIDPFCGSGTIGIEAALRRAALPPGGEREFAFHQWRDFEPGAWASVVAMIGADSAESEPIIVSDRDPAAVEAARANAERAGVADMIQIEERPVSHLKGHGGPAALVTNPPYGRRIGGSNLTGLYRRLGSVVRERLPRAGLTLVTSDRALARSADRDLAPVARFGHGGVKVAAYHRPAGSLEGETGPAR